MLGQTCTATARAFPKFCLSTEGPSRSTEALIALQHETLANRLGYVKSLAEVLPLSEACVVRFEGWMRDLLAVSQNGKEFLPVLNQYNTCTGAKKKNFPSKPFDQRQGAKLPQHLRWVTLGSSSAFISAALTTSTPLVWMDHLQRASSWANLLPLP